MQRFEFATAHRVIFGAGTVSEVPAAAAGVGKRALLVTGASGERAEPLRKSLEAAGVSCEPVRISGEPTIATIQSAPRDADMVIAMGGGSALDAGKAIAAMITNPGDVLDYLEVVGQGRALPNPAAPCIAIPTTAGTGSEVTRNAVLGSPEHRVKASLRSAGMLPWLAVVDPELTMGLPRAITASTGLDALTQLIEAYLSVKSNWMTHVLCTDGIGIASVALPRVWANGDDLEARTLMSWASLLGGMALANAGLGVVHGFAAPIGGMFPAPHGAICAAILPHAMGVNMRAMRRRAPTKFKEFEAMAELLSSKLAPTAEDAVQWLADLVQKLEIPTLRTYGVTENHVDELVEKASRANSTRGNGVELTREELKEVIRAAL
jgi:alcohol dehydrogenase class IV